MDPNDRNKVALKRYLAEKGIFSSMAAQLAGIFAGMMALTFVFQGAKHVLHPELTLWESHIVTNVVCTFLATVAAYFVMSHQAQLLKYAIGELHKRQRAEDALRLLKERLEQEKVKLEEVLSVEENLSAIFNLNQLIDYIVETCCRVLEAKRCSLMLYDNDNKELCLRGHKGISEQSFHKFKTRLGDSISGIVAAEGKPILVTDIEADGRFARPNRKAYAGRSFLVVPIKIGNRLIGVINVAEKAADENVFTQLDLKILSMITRQVAVAIETARLYRRLNYLTITDKLTGMHNYRHLAKNLDREISRLQRYPGSLCLLLLDIDNLRSYNEEFGHAEGDLLLREMGRIFNENIRGVDISCRYAGDEFMVVLPQTELYQAKRVAERLTKRAGTLLLNRPMTLSIGIAEQYGVMNRYDLILKADAALYRAKKLGHGRIFAERSSPEGKIWEKGGVV